MPVSTVTPSELRSANHLENAPRRPKFKPSMKAFHDTVHNNLPIEPTPSRTRTFSREIIDKIINYSDNKLLYDWVYVSMWTRHIVHKKITRNLQLDYTINHPRETLDYATDLLRLLEEDQELLRTVNSLSIIDDADSGIRSVERELMHFEDDLGEDLALAQRRKRLCPGILYFHGDAARIMERVTRLKELEICMIDFVLNWETFTVDAHYAKDITNVLRLNTLTCITLQGITDIPLVELQNATSLTSLSLFNFSISFYDVQRDVPPLIFLIDLRMGGFLMETEDLAEYLQASDTVISIKRLRVLNLEFEEDNDGDLASILMGAVEDQKSLEVSLIYLVRLYSPRKLPTN
ncbi:hypothetical protein BDN70DRAFT_931469 [Pholiota conissans]|uniref:Uncharacterized protein n=1 Tax=Pholiota conissans TaxID=109636 RepID=A0A9P5Z3F3_9AGAR|nr:hypothetical protein BDN70DRAFT_931469 [Pholiota conissans]